MTKADSKISRRGALLMGGGALAAVGAIAAISIRPVTARINELVRGATLRRPASLATGSYEDWLAQVGSDFAIGGGTTLRLTGVQALNSAGTRPSMLRSRAFLAVLDPQGGRTLAGNLIYTATHRATGPLQIFLQNAPDPKKPARMLAVFN